MIIIALLKELFSAKIIASANSISYPRHLFVLMHALNFEACFSIKFLYCTYMICFDAFLKLVYVICLSRGFFSSYALVPSYTTVLSSTIPTTAGPLIMKDFLLVPKNQLMVATDHDLTTKMPCSIKYTDYPY